MATFFVTALSISPQKQGDRVVPQVVSLDTTKVVSAIVVANNVTAAENVIVKSMNPRYRKTVRTAESLGEYLKASDWSNAAGSPYNTGTAASVAASGASAAASATPLTAYHNAVTAATASTMTGVRLPSASGANYGTATVVQNKSSIAVLVFPASGEFLDGSTAGSTSIAAGQFKHFYASATNKTVTCRGPYY